MREIVGGHLYELANLKTPGTSELRFYMDPALHHGATMDGPSTQEVLRACIARVAALDAEKPAPENALILGHLRAAIVLFETRALRVKLERQPVESLPVNATGHLWGLTEP